MKNKRLFVIVIACLFMVGLAACQSEPVTADGLITNAPTEEPVITNIIAPTNTVVPTNTPEPTKKAVVTNTTAPTATNTPVPTATSTPTPVPTATATPSPSPSPEPTASPVPTATPTPVPTATPEPTATPVPTATPTPSPTVAPTATPAPTKAPEKEVAVGEVWQNVVDNLINAGVAEEINDYYGAGLSGDDKPKTPWTFWAGNKDIGSRSSELATDHPVLIDSMHKAGIGLPTQYGIIVMDMDNVWDSSLVPNIVYGIVNKTTGEFVFSTICNDDYFRALVYKKEQFGKNLKFANGDSGMVCSRNLSTDSKYGGVMDLTGIKACTDFFNDFQIRFDNEINTSEYNFFVTSCDMETWLANEDWYYDNSYTVVDDFYGNIDRMWTEGADIQFWEIKNNWDY